MTDFEDDATIIPLPTAATYCTCAEPDPLLIPLWQALECRICRRPVQPADPVEETNERKYSMNEVARLFRTTPGKIKERALRGDLPYCVNARGNFEFPRDSLLAHLDELSRRNNRLG